MNRRNVVSLVAVALAACLGCAVSGVHPLAALPMRYEMVEEPVAHDPESYKRIDDTPFQTVRDHPLSTFSVDVDTASYSNVRRFLASGSLPPKDAVRVEELINYFPYAYSPPREGPFAANVEIAAAPWSPDHRLVRIGIKGKETPRGPRPASNLVFLLDVSGSMSDPNKLPLLKKALRMLVEQLGEADRVAIAVYAGASGLVLPSTSCAEKGTILRALESLEAGGSTNGGEGIQLAYKVASEHFIPGGVNRVLLATDGDFNVGVTSEGELTRLIEERAKTGVFLSVLGFGMGNYKDSVLEQIADRGNGNYAYIDTELEARKVLVEQMRGTLVTIAKDVKLQVEFNPRRVTAYRLIGYENRMLKAEDFRDDKKDAGDIGEGHTVTALYEIVPAGRPFEGAKVDPLKYQEEKGLSSAAESDELLTVKIRYKAPDAAESQQLSFPVVDEGRGFAQASEDFRFAASVASFGMLLRESPHRGQGSFQDVVAIASGALGDDRSGYRREFVEMVRAAAELRRGD